MAAKMKVGLESMASRIRHFELRSTGTSNSSSSSGPLSPVSGSGSGKKIFSSDSLSEISSTTSKPNGHPISMMMTPKKVAIVLPPRKTMQPRTKEDWFEHLVSSEEEYCNFLQAFKEEYVRPLKDDSKTPKPIYFSRIEFQKVVVFLTNVEALLTLNSRFRDDLKSRRTEGLGEVLAQYAPLFQMYGQYAADHSAVLEAIAQQSDSNDRLKEFLKQKEEATGKSIIELMQLPLDRIQLYTESMDRLLELCRNEKPTAVDEREMASLHAASEELHRTAEHVQEQQLATERLDRFKELQREWVGGNLLAGSVARQFIMEGDLEKFSRKHSVRYRFLLFSDVLTYGVASAMGDKVRFKRSFPLATMVVEETANSAQTRSKAKRDSKSSLDGVGSAGQDDMDEDAISGSASDASDDLCFFILTPTKSFKVAADSRESRALWISEIRHYIDLAKSGKAAASGAVQADGTSSLPEVSLKPVWVPDVESKACMKCNSVFTMIRRRHHCRRCGMLVCAPCSRHRIAVQMAIGKDSTKTKEVRVRVCSDCVTRRPSVRFSSGFTHDDSFKKQLSALSEAFDDANSSDEEKMGPSDAHRRSSVSSTGVESPLVGEIVFDDSNVVVAPSQSLVCIVVEPRGKAQLQNPDEIVLELNDIVHVEEIVAGWATGTNTRTGEYGYLPANFVVVKDTKEELPEYYDGSTAQPQQTPPLPPAQPPQPPKPISINAMRRLSSDSGDSPRPGSIGSDNEHRLSLTGPLHRRTSSNTNSGSLGTEDESVPRGATHRRSGSSNDDASRRASSATQATQLLTFTDKRALIMNEIVITERTYLASLNALLTVFVRPLVVDYKSGKPQYGGSVLAVMNEAGDGAAMSVFMSRLEHIVTLNSKLAIDLEARLAQWASCASPELGGDSKSCTCGDVFLRYAPLFNMYDEYSSSYEFATKALVDREKSDAKLAKFFEDQSANNVGLLKQQTLLSLLITPIQRVPRYLLLLKEMLKQTPDGHPDKELIDKAISTISQVASHINEHIRERENMVALREIDREFNGAEQLTDNPSRVFIHRGDLVKQSRKKNDMYQFWLFSDMLMYQKRTFGPKGVYAKPPKRIDMATLNVVEVPEEDSVPKFAFELVSQSKSFRVFATDSLDKDKWMRSLTEAIESATGGKGGTKKGELAPVWKQDTASCEVCEAAFTFLFRRHHCRACGKCVCDKCSRNRLFLKHVDEFKEVRVCNPCFESLGGDSAPRKPPPKTSSSKRELKSASLTSSLSSPAVGISKGTYSSGLKRSQGESSIATKAETSPASSSAIAGIVSASQISMISRQMSQRRKEREESWSPGSSPMKEAPRPMSQRDASSGGSTTTARSSSSPVSAQHRVPFNSPGTSKLRQVLSESDDDDEEEEVVAAEPQSKKSGLAVSSAFSSSTMTTELVQESSPPFSRPQGFSEVLQQIRHEVPLEAPKVIPKPIMLMETPKPITPARIASPATLSPISPTSSPKVGAAFNKSSHASPLAAAALSREEEEDEAAFSEPPTKKAPSAMPFSTPSSQSNSTPPPPIPPTRPPSFNDSKPKTTSNSRSALHPPTQPSRPAAAVVSNPAAELSSIPKATTSPPKLLPPPRSQATSTSRPTSLPPSGKGTTEDPSGDSKPPPPLPKRRPSNLGSMPRTESSKSVTTITSNGGVEAESASAEGERLTERSLQRSDTADTIDKSDYDML